MGYNSGFKGLIIRKCKEAHQISILFNGKKVKWCKTPPIHSFMNIFYVITVKYFYKPIDDLFSYIKSRYKNFTITLHLLQNLHLNILQKILHQNYQLLIYFQNKLPFVFKVCKSVHRHTIQINQPPRCNNFASLLLDVYIWLNMFRSSSRPSSGAQQLQ